MGARTRGLQGRECPCVCPAWDVGPRPVWCVRGAVSSCSAKPQGARRCLGAAAQAAAAVPICLCHRACDNVPASLVSLHAACVSCPLCARAAATGTAPLWARRGRLPVCEVLHKRGNGWKSSPHSHFNQRNEAAVGVNRPCTKADVLISFAEEVHCDSFCASLLLSF